MDKKSLALLLVASTFASSTFATTIINQLITKHSSALPPVANTHQMTKQTNHPYTDFSGTWLVDCGDGVIGSTVIENDASYITVNGNGYRIGKGLEGQSESNEKYVGSEQTSLEWNEDGSALIIKSVDFSKDNIDNSAFELDISKIAFTMKNGQINLDGKWTMFEDLTQIHPPTDLHCVFKKKQ